MRDYHLDEGSPRCAVKVDILKVYDTLDWEFLMSTLSTFGFPSRLIDWIRRCVTTTRFSIAVNGELTRFFPAKRGLRQGDPLSPYLFIIAMEMFSRMVQHSIDASPGFRYHWRCDKIKITHLAFADDLLLFCHGDISSAMVLKRALERVSAASGLTPNSSKSNCFMTGLSPPRALVLQDCFGLPVGDLPIRYLGVPLITSKLSFKDCAPLLEKIDVRIRGWEHRALSFAGRLLLINFVLCSVQVY